MSFEDMNNIIDDLYTPLADSPVFGGGGTFSIIRKRQYYSIYDADRTPTQETEESFSFNPVRIGQRLLDREKTGAGRSDNLGERAVIPVSAATSMSLEEVIALLEGSGELTSDISGSGLVETVKCYVNDRGISINAHGDVIGNQLVIDFIYDRN